MNKHKLVKCGSVHGMPGLQTMNHHELLVTKQTGLVHEVCDSIERLFVQARGTEFAEDLKLTFLCLPSKFDENWI